MQPNQPTSYPPNPPSQNGSNIPEYLHLEPIVDPNIAIQASHNKRNKILLLIGVIILLVLGAIGLFLYIQQNTPEAKLYQALENTMESNYIVRNYEAKIRNFDKVTTATMTIKTDASNPVSPKSDIHETYTEKVGQKVTSGYTGQFKTFDNNDLYLN